ncbi:MAG: hypothetical protein ACOYOH_11600 [Paracraurococcus sp.]
MPLAQQAIDYNTSIETAANTVLLRNVLRVRDNAPLHFTSIPQVRGSVSLGMTQPGLLFPVSGGIGTSNGAGIGLQALSSPSFDVASFDTQDLTRGLLEPVKPQVYRYFEEQGYPQQMLVLLFFESVVDPVTGARLPNDPRCWFDRPACPGRTTAPSIENAFMTTGGQGRYFFHEYASLTAVGASLTPDQARNPAMLADGRLRLMPAGDGEFQLFREETRQAVCRRPNRPDEAGRMGNGAACGRREVVQPPQPPGISPAEDSNVQVQTRSVADLCRFLGDVVRVQEDIRLHEGEALRCLAFPLRAALPGMPSPEACLFHITRDPDDALPSGTAFSGEHEGQTYRVPAFAEPAPDGSRRGDYTLPVIALVTELLNLKKSSAAIPATRAVQLVR